jgi:hypothetical protein
MKTVKRVSTDWDIYAGKVTINGNLVVVGTSTQVESVNTFVTDSFITLAAGQGGLVNAGIEIDRGTNPPVGLRWNATSEKWQYTNDGILWKTFSITVVEEDKAPRLGGNLFVQDSNGNDFWITHNPGKDVTIGPVIRLPQITSDPGPKTGFSTIYAKATKAGDTGFYVANERVDKAELITKRKAFIFSIIF